MQISNQKSPSSKIIISHFVLGALALSAASILIIFHPDAFTRHYFNPKLLSITHLLVLGWITMIIFGVLCQLTPVITDGKLFSEKMAVVSMVALAAGSVCLPAAFFYFKTGLVLNLAAAFIVLAALLQSANMYLTVNASNKKSIHVNFILTALAWLLFTVTIGFMLAVNLANPFITSSHLEFLKLHAHAGIIGWFLQLIIGISSKIIPMFMVSHHLNMKKLSLSYYSVNAGLILGIISLYIQWKTGVTAGTFIVIAGVIFFLSFIMEAYRKRVRKMLDTGLKQTFVAFISLLLPMTLIIILTSGMPAGPAGIRLAVIYGSSLILGFISSLVMAQTYKILPFIVWMNSYRHLLGKQTTPLPKDLYSDKLAGLHGWLFAAAFTVLLPGAFFENDLLIRSAGVIMLCSVLIYNYNIYHIISHTSHINTQPHHAN